MLESSLSLHFHLIVSLLKNWKSRQHSQQEGASWITATFLLVNAALGVGLLNFPVAYDRLGGIGFSTFVQVVLLLVVASTMIILVYCADQTGVSSYHEVFEKMCGQTVRQMAALSILIQCFGICVTFLIIIGDQFDRIFATFFGNQFCYFWYLNRKFTIIFTTTVTIWPMSYFKRLDILKYVNILGVFAMFYVIFLNVYEYYKLEVNPGPIKNYPDDILSIISALPVICLSYQTHEIVVPVYASLKERNVKNFLKITSLSLSILFVLYYISGTYGYLTFGGNVAPDVMLMYNPSDPIVSAGIVALIVKMISTYPLYFFAGRDTFIGLFSNKQPVEEQKLLMDRTSDLIEFRKRVIITSVWNVAGLILAVVTPNITIALEFQGSLAVCNVLILPGLCMIALARRLSDRGAEQQNNKRFPQIFFIYGIFIIITGVLMFIIISFKGIIDISHGVKHELFCK